MKTDILRFKAITHLSEAEVLELTKEMNTVTQGFFRTVSPSKNRTHQGITILQKSRK